MAPQRPKPSNLAILIRAIAEAYHRDINGRPVYQQISFRTEGIVSSASVHLWKHGGVKNVTGTKLQAIAAAYDFDFARLLNFIYGPPTKLSGDELLATLRPDIGGQGAKRLRPIGGGSHPDGALPVEERERIVDEVLDSPRGWGWTGRMRDIMSRWRDRLVQGWGCTWPSTPRHFGAWVPA